MTRRRLSERTEATLRWAVALILSVVVAMLVGLAIVSFVSSQNAAHDATAGRNQTAKSASARITALTAQVGALTDQVVQLRDQLIAAGQVPAVALPAKQVPVTTTTTVRRSTGTTTPRTTTTVRTPTRTEVAPTTTTTTARPSPTTTTTVLCRGVAVAGACIGG